MAECQVGSGDVVLSCIRAAASAALLQFDISISGCCERVPISSNIEILDMKIFRVIQRVPSIRSSKDE